MRYDAITIDTNIFRQNGGHLEGGMLAQLVQFKEGSVQLVISEIVIRELARFLKDEIKNARESIRRASKDALKHGVLPVELVEEMRSVIDIASAPEEAAKKRIQSFAGATAMTIVQANQADMKELVRRYFEPSAPFEASGNKKSEFPDAIALLSLEAWAQSTGKKILAVSNDKGWADFATSSAFIDVETDLAKALEVLQKFTEEAEEFIHLLLKKIDDGEYPDLFKDLTDALSDAVGELDVTAEASSPFHFEADPVAVCFVNFQFEKSENEHDLAIVQIGKDKIVARIRVTIDANAECDFSLSIWDSIDKEYISLGSTSAETSIEFDAAVLVTFSLDESKDLSRVKLLHLEIVEAIDSVEFGDIQIEHDEDHYDI